MPIGDGSSSVGVTRLRRCGDLGTAPPASATAGHFDLIVVLCVRHDHRDAYGATSSM